MSSFEIISFEGALPLSFGMSPAEITEILGEPQTASPGWDGALNYGYHSPGLNLNVGFSKQDESAVHFGFDRDSAVYFQGLNMFGDPTAWRTLIERSHDCHEWVGFIVCCDLGIQLSGFHDHDDSQLAVVAFPKGAREKNRHRFKPFVLVAEA